MNSTFIPVKTAMALVLAASSLAAAALPARLAQSPAEALQLLSNTASGQIVSSQRADEGFTAVHAAVSSVLYADGGTGSPLSRAQNFLALYGALPGVTDAANQLTLNRVSDDAAGNTHVHLDQMHNGLAVFGARLVVHLNQQGVTGVNGVFLPGLESLSITAGEEISVLRARALAAALKLHPEAKNLVIESTRLMIYNTGLLQGLPGSNRLAYEVVINNGVSSGIREQMIMDANNGFLLNRIDRIDRVLHRKTYTPVYGNALIYEDGKTATQLPTMALVQKDPPFTGDTTRTTPSTRPSYEPLDNLHLFAEGTWRLYKNMFGRDGYNDKSSKIPVTGQVQESVLLTNNNCPNAYWDGVSANYCAGFDLDDVVSHEWSHAYTEYTHGLVYQYQSGALNEAYSDIYGETYDLINGFEGNVGRNFVEGKYYKQKDTAGNPGSRWVVGEDLSQKAAETLLRDMWDPDAFPTPSPGSTNKAVSPSYACGTGDNGGVHTNSGVANHAYAMLVDGRPNAQDNTTFNKQPVPAIGLIKAANIFFQAETHYQTPTTNYAQHADALDQSCKDLLGVNLNDVFGKPSGQLITAADCDAVAMASLAVEYRKSVTVQCNYLPVLKAEASTPALCPSGKFVNVKYSEGFNGATFPTDWSQGITKATTFDSDIKPWGLSANLPAPHTGQAAFFENNRGGTCTTGGDQSSSHFMTSPMVAVTDAANFMTFTHFMQSETGFDGGNLKYSLNGAAFALVPATAFTFNGHSGKFTAPMAPTTPTGNNTSPNAGQVAWTGSDQGEATGSWGTTIVDLSKLTVAAKTGDKVQFRFDFANDGCGGNLGWFVEDVKTFICDATPPPNTLPVASLKADKTSGEAPLSVQLTLGGTDADTVNGDKVTSFAVNYGEGSAASSENYASGSSSKTNTHLYNTPGTYTVSLTVKDSFGAESAPVMQKIVVTPKAGTAPAPAPTPTTPVGSMAPVTSAATPAQQSGRFGGGAFGALALLPFAAMALRRRRKLH